MAVFCAQPLQPAFSAPAKSPNEKELIESFIAAVSKPDAAAKNTFSDVAQNMDFEEMAKRSFGDAGWTKFSLEEQKEVVGLFKRLVEIRFYPRWRRVFQNGKYEMSSQTKEGTDTLVAGTLQLSGKTNGLTFRLVNSRNGFKLVSMAVKDKDLLERTAVRMKRGLKHKGAAGLIAHLKKKTADGTTTVSDKAQLEELISGAK